MNFTTCLYKRNEIILHSSKAYENPFLDVDIDAVFTCDDGTVLTLPGFWNGGSEWKVRFSLEKVGSWNYEITCTDAENASLCDSGTVKAVPVENPKTELERHGYPRLEQGKRYFVYDDGTPFFYLADTHWMMPDYERLHECNFPGCSCGNQFKHVVDDRVKKGFNVYQTYFASARSKTSAAGTEGWWEAPFTLINPKPFNDTMDVMMDYLCSQGMAVSLGFGTHYATIKQYGNVPDGILKFVRYAVARYACYPVIWITGQEITTPMDNAFEIWRMVGAEVGRLDGYHRPNGAHMHAHDAKDPRSLVVDEQPWHQWWTVQGGHGGYLRLRNRQFYQSFYECPSNKPFIETECQYEDIYCCGFCGHEAPRFGAWQAVQSGSAGFTYGVTGIWAMSWDQKLEPAYTSYNPENWYHGIVKPGSEQVGYMKKFYEYVGWYKLKPEYGFDYGNFDMRKYVSISRIDRDVFVYYFFNMDENIGYLTGLKENVRYQTRLFDTVTGRFIDLPDTVTPDGKADIPKFPIGHRDWVLLLNDYDLGEYETEAYPENPKPIPPQDAQPGEEYKIKLFASSEDAEHPASNLTDGRPDTYWQGYAPMTGQVLIADLGGLKELGYLYWRCDLPEHRFIQFRVFTSDDNEHWDLAAERTWTEVLTGGKYNDYYEPLNGKHRYVKLYFNSLPNDASVKTPLTLTHLRIYGKK